MSEVSRTAIIYLRGRTRDRGYDDVLHGDEMALFRQGKLYGRAVNESRPIMLRHIRLTPTRPSQKMTSVFGLSPPATR